MVVINGWATIYRPIWDSQASGQRSFTVRDLVDLVYLRMISSRTAVESKSNHSSNTNHRLSVDSMSSFVC